MYVYDPENASRATFNADPEVAELIIRMAQDRLHAQQAAGNSLDNRVTQVAYFQLAAAAFSGAFVFQSVKLSWASAASALSCALFVLGALIAFLGVRTGRQQLAGMPPSWWFTPVTGGEDVIFLKTARAMLAQATEDMISFNDKHDDARAVHLNRSLLAGALAGVAIVVASILKIFTL